jgi:recombination protein RecT
VATQLLAPSDEGKRIQRLFAANLDSMKKSAPRFVGDAGRLIRVAYNAIVYNDDLRKCTHESLIGGVMECIKLGITIGGPMQEGWLIPFNDSRQNCKVATLIIGYQGYRNIIDRGRAVLDLHPNAVHKGDEFDFELGSKPFIKHKPAWLADPNVKYMPFRGKGRPPDLLAVYAVAHIRGGGTQFQVLNVEEVESHRLRSRAKDNGPWVTDYEQMAIKTAIRVIAKYLPKSSELLARALDLDDKADRGVAQDFDTSGLVITDEGDPGAAGKAARPSSFAALKDRMAPGAADVPAELKPEDEATLSGPTAEEIAENNRIDAEAAKEG